MCCFSGPVAKVADTGIFARAIPGSANEQLLVYGMTYAAPADLAMVLPIPVPPGAAENAVTFINLEAYPKFFKDLHWVFDPPLLGGSSGAPNLAVHDVGSFEASFVPCIADFDRLEPRFRITGEVWDRLPGYAEFGFAVFKLKGTGSKSDSGRQVHPMAFTFPRRNPEQLFFPTVHVHDGQVHPVAWFDHALYCQIEGSVGDTIHYPLDLDPEVLARWDFTEDSMRAHMNTVRNAGSIIDPDQSLWRLKLKFQRENRDTIVGTGGSVPRLRL